eukprot:scaffold376_cov24-Phaeocystis_antarctica.AAC.1
MEHHSNAWKKHWLSPGTSCNARPCWAARAARACGPAAPVRWASAAGLAAGPAPAFRVGYAFPCVAVFEFVHHGAASAARRARRA